jgi:hypothetical protein
VGEVRSKIIKAAICKMKIIKKIASRILGMFFIRYLGSLRFLEIDALECKPLGLQQS